MTTPSPTVTVDSLPALSYRDVPVITTALLARVYGTEPNNLTKNFANNADRFDAGKHYFKLEGEALRKFKELHRVKNSHSVADSVEISPRVNALMLWTERGAARHAKMLETDLAWEVFEQLEDAYFRPREAQAEPQPAPAPAPVIEPPAPPAPAAMVEMSLEQFGRIMAPLYGVTIRQPPARIPVAAPAPAPAKPVPRPVTEAERVEALERYTSGQSIRAISKAMGRSHSTIRRILDQANADADPQIALRLLDGGAS
jgi:hypothetical protein